jgi:hypothetical protein
MHPPAQYLAEPFARRGGEIVPFLKEKLAQAQDDLTVRDIVLVFAEMGRQRSYDVSKDVDLIRQMREAAARMKNQDWRTITEQRIEAACPSPKPHPTRSGAPRFVNSSRGPRPRAWLE